jgi:hypothetical protein
MNKNKYDFYLEAGKLLAIVGEKTISAELEKDLGADLIRRLNDILLEIYAKTMSDR